MKNKLLLLSFGLFMTTQIIFSQVPSYVPSNGLVGYWGFNGNANDQSGNGNNGTVNGATLTTDRFGNANSAYSFDGVNDYIRCLNVGAIGNSSRSVSFWLKSNSNFPGSIISYGNNDVSSQDFRIIQNGLGVCGQNGDVSCVITGSGRGVQYVSNNNWDFFTVVYDNSIGTNLTNIKIYKNGILNTSYCDENSSNVLNTSSVNPITFGCYHWLNYTGNKQFLSGVLDDIGIWNRALTAQEITAMYNGVNYSDTCNAVSGSLTQGLVGYWPFCGNANDDSGNGNNGTVNGATLTTDRFGNANSAYSFDGVLGTHINVPLAENLQGNKSFSCWIQLPLNFVNPYCNFITGKNQTIVLSNDYLSINGNEASYVLNNTVGHFYDGKTGVGLFSSNDLNNNIWHHIVLTHNYTNQEVKLFIDGVLIESTISNGLNTNSIIDRFIFGSDLNNNISANATLYGNLDDIGIWNRVLTPQEITQLYNQNQCFTNITVTDTLVINVGQLSYTNPIAYANSITIAPNPASTQININFNNITDLNGGSIKIINSLGQEVATTPITTSGTNTAMSLDTWGGAGLYFVQILNAQGQILDIKKIILQ